MSGLCHVHRDALASFRCETCGKRLCYDCVDEDAPTGASCRSCGGPATLAGDGWSDPEPAPAPAGEPETLYAPESRGGGAGSRGGEARSVSTAEALLWTPAALLAHHVAVPAATIAMVAALLFFLVDLRSVFLGGGQALKWVGFWFVTATVLTARYGKMVQGSFRSDRQGCYTLALAGATILVMVVSPWDPAAPDLASLAFNGLIILGIWRFATALTRGLSLEGERWPSGGRRVFGLERLALQRWQEQQEDRPSVKLPAPAETQEGGARRGDPCAATARLAAVALLIFAVGEPWILSGAAAVGVRALATMIVFLLATGVVLGSASAIVTYRRIRDAGGLPATAAVPGRLAASAALTVLILSIALAVPGIEYRGSGELRPRLDRSEGDGERAASEADDGGEATADDGTAASDPAEDSPTAGPGPAEGRPDGEAGGRQGPRSPPGTGGAAALLQALSELGRLLRIPIFLTAAALVLYGLWRLWPLLARLRWRHGLGDRWRRLLDRLGALFRGFRSRPAARPQPDPFRDFEALSRLAPRDAVLTAYTRALEHLGQIGLPRPDRQTPLEYQNHLSRSLPGDAGHLLRPVAALTATYLEAAYSGRDVVAADRQTAVAALAELRRAAGA